MATFRVHKETNYSTIDNQPINDKDLSWAARGLLIYLLSKPDDWTVRTADLIRQSPAKRDATQTIINELKQAGYLERIQVQDPTTGKIYYETNVYERPVNGLSGDGSSVDGKPGDLVSTESLRTESKDSSADADTPPKEKKKSRYVIRSEILEQTFADVRGCKLPDWEKNPRAANKRWRLPLNRMFALADGKLHRTGYGIQQVVKQMMSAGLTFDAPDQIEKTFNSWLIDHKNGHQSTPDDVHLYGGTEVVDYSRRK